MQEHQQCFITLKLFTRGKFLRTFFFVLFPLQIFLEKFVGLINIWLNSKRKRWKLHVDVSIKKIHHSPLNGPCDTLRRKSGEWQLRIIKAHEMTGFQLLTVKKFFATFNQFVLRRFYDCRVARSQERGNEISKYVRSLFNSRVIKKKIAMRHEYEVK